MKRTVKKVIDGDTFETKTKVRGSNYVRLSDYDAPPLNTKEGKLAKDRLKRALGNKPVNITTVGRSYSRVVAKVRNGRKSVNKKMKGYGY
jgi:endonuclease YncB( thermonuclease family)